MIRRCGEADPEAIFSMKSLPSRTWTVFPFLNSGDTVLVNIASVNNRSWKCDVKRASMGFELMSEDEYQPASEILKRSATFMLMPPVMIAVLFLSGLALFHLDFVQQAVGIITKAVSPTLARLGMDPRGSLGFISGMIWSLVIGWSSRQLLSWWNRRLQRRSKESGNGSRQFPLQHRWLHHMFDPLFI